MRHQANLRFFRVTILAVCYSIITVPFVLGQNKATTSGSTTMRESNLAAPELYSDKLGLNVSLADLPGATEPGSSWEMSYQIFFISEGEYYSVINKLPPGGHSLQPELFPHKVLLAEDTFRRKNLGSSAARTQKRDDIILASKVANQEKTKFGRLMTSYSVKVYDARLKMPILHSGVFVTYVFEKSLNTVLPRKALYLAFSVTSQGELSYSQQSPSK